MKIGPRLQRRRMPAGLAFLRRVERSKTPKLLGILKGLRIHPGRMVPARSRATVPDTHLLGIAAVERLRAG